MYVYVHRRVITHRQPITGHILCTHTTVLHSHERQHKQCEHMMTAWNSQIHTSSLQPWWRHQMETFSALLALCHRSPVNSPHKGQWRGALMFSLICTWINIWVNNRDAGSLGRHSAHYDVIVMTTSASLQALSSHIIVFIWTNILEFQKQVYFNQIFQVRVNS